MQTADLLSSTTPDSQSCYTLSHFSLTKTSGEWITCFHILQVYLKHPSTVALSTQCVCIYTCMHMGMYLHACGYVCASI